MKKRSKQRRPPPGRRPSSSGSSSRRGPTGAKAHTSRPLREDLVTQACLEAYGLVRHENRLADRALDGVLRAKRNLYSNERRAVAERVYALLRRQLTVDFLLEQVRPGLARLPTSRQDLLRLATSRILLGERPQAVLSGMAIPPVDREALDELPAAASRLEAMPPRQRYPLAASVPQFLADRFLAELGPEAEAFAEAMNERAPLTARANTLKTDREALWRRLAEEEVESVPCAHSPLGLVLETRVNAFSVPSFRDGWFELQDEGSQLLGMLVDAPPTKVVDACAGAGGKTLQLAAQMHNRGELFALDVDERRMEDLKKRARRAGVHNVRAQVIPEGGPAAREALAALQGKADRVLVDAPCSGTGTFRRKPDARYRLTEAQLAQHVARQKDLLDRFSELVKPGGRLIYGTCSVLREENEGVVEDFLARHPEFEPIPAQTVLGPALAARTCQGGNLRLYPHRHGTDGFFGAVLARRKATSR